ncbi:MAG: IclR family transcriptional regulator [Spirochaetaceae bacterium]|jgi:DNA-binding IclR family transcriptional regulator|nr:IclR family transcriptional regulator [Spirochaetaceae bacterium]
MEKKGHRLLQSALEILDAVADSAVSLGFKDICGLFQLPKSTIHNLVQTMLNMEYLQKDLTGHYRIGIRCFKTGNAFRLSDPFTERARQIVEELHQTCNENTCFAVLERTDVVYIYEFDSTQVLRVYAHDEKRKPAHATALGKALLSGYTDEEIRSLYSCEELQVFTPRTLCNLDALIEHLREVRRSHVAYDLEETHPHVNCIAVPVMNSKGFPVAALSFTFPTFREEVTQEQLLALLQAAARKMELLYRLYE